MADDPLETERALLERAKHPDTSENFARAVAQIVALTVPFAANHMRRFDETSRNHPPRVGFFLPSTTVLAHTAVLQTYLRGLRQIGGPIEPFVFTFGEKSLPFEQSLAAKTEYFPTGTLLERWLELQKLGLTLRLDALVHVSVPFGLAFAAAIRCARRHIWWSMKWHTTVPGVDGYIDTTGGQIGPPWRKAYCALPEMLDRDSTAPAARIRAGLRPRTVFGTLCREEKITSQFALAVQRILTEVPESIFVYSGRQEAKELSGLNRVQWIGWVNTAVWSQVIDVYLDTWPFPSGYTAWEAIAALRPIVMMEPDPRAEQAWVAGQMQSAGHSCCLASDIDTYVLLAKRMAAGELSEFVLSNNAFYESHMRNERRMASEVTSAIVDTLARPLSPAIA